MMYGIRFIGAWLKVTFSRKYRYAELRRYVTQLVFLRLMTRMSFYESATGVTPAMMRGLYRRCGIPPVSVAKRVVLVAARQERKARREAGGDYEQSLRNLLDHGWAHTMRHGDGAVRLDAELDKLLAGAATKNE
jgi:hypothetical protein